MSHLDSSKDGYEKTLQETENMLTGPLTLCQTLTAEEITAEQPEDDEWWHDQLPKVKPAWY